LPEDRIVIVDAGHFGSFAQQGLTVRSPRDYAFTHDFGAIGQGIGIAIGAAVARPGDRVTLVLGDGCFVMSLNELATAVRYGLDITFFVMDDGGYGQERHAMNVKGMPSGPSDHSWPDIASIASGFGIPSLDVRVDAQLAHLADWLQAQRGPALVNVHVDPDVQNRAFADIADRLRRGSRPNAAG
jgi:acetolactate synthase-1/2/3 large subunit